MAQVLRARSLEIVADARTTIKQARLEHYEAESREQIHGQIQALYDMAVLSMSTRNAAPLLRFVERIARERYASGFDLSEVQSAMNALEEAIWKRLLLDLRPEEFPPAIGLVSTVLGLGKDALARTYVALAAETNPPFLDAPTLVAEAGGSSRTRVTVEPT